MTCLGIADFSTRTHIITSVEFHTRSQNTSRLVRLGASILDHGAKGLLGVISLLISHLIRVN